MGFRDVKVEELQKYKIFVATPCYGGMASGIYTKSTNEMTALFTKYGIDVKYFFLFNESLVQRARNYCSSEFLRSDCTHLLFIDADIGFSANDVLSLLAVHHSDPEKYNIVAAPYPKKTIAWEKVKQAATDGFADNPFDLAHYTADYVFNVLPETSSFDIGNPLEVLETGTGFMLISRNVFVKYAKEYPEYSYKPDHIRTENFDGKNEITAFFDCSIDPESKRYLSEDYHFCQYARKIGIRVWVLPWLRLTHLGSYAYTGSMQALASLGASPTATLESSEKHHKNKKTKTKNRKAFRP